MVMVAARVIRVTAQARPGYGASSIFRNCQSQAASSSVLASYDHDGRLAQAKGFRLWRENSHAHRITRRQVHPIERALDVGQAGRERSHQRWVGLYPEA